MKEKEAHIKQSDWKTLQRVIKLALPFKNLFIFSISFAILSAFVTAVRPMIIQYIIDVNIV